MAPHGARGRSGITCFLISGTSALGARSRSCVSSSFMLTHSSGCGRPSGMDDWCSRVEPAAPVRMYCVCIVKIVCPCCTASTVREENERRSELLDTR